MEKIKGRQDATHLGYRNFLESPNVKPSLSKEGILLSLHAQTKRFKSSQQIKVDYDGFDPNAKHQEVGVCAQAFHRGPIILAYLTSSFGL